MTLRQYVESKGWTPSEAARALGLSQGQCWDLIHDKRPCSKKVAIRIARATEDAVSVVEAMFPGGVPTFAPSPEA